MYEELYPNYEYIADHIRDYFQENKFFDVFEAEDIKKIFEKSKLSIDDFSFILKQSSSIMKAKDIYTLARCATLLPKNLKDVITIMKSLKEYLNFRIFDKVIDILHQTEKELCENSERIEKLQKEISTPKDQGPTNIFMSLFNKIGIIRTQPTEGNNSTSVRENSSENILAKITQLKDSDDFEAVYILFEELTKGENKKMLTKAIDDGLWEKKTKFYGENLNIFHFACLKGNLNLVYSLVQHGLDKEIKSNFKGTPLNWASFGGHLEVVQYLISIGINIDEKSKYGFTQLIWAADNGHLDVVQYLCSIGFDKDQRSQYGFTPLICASRNGHLEVVKYLISIGADKDVQDKDGKTSLIRASGNGHLEVVKYLISIGADKEAEDNLGYTSLTCTSLNCHLNVVEYLISVGANKETRDDLGNTPLILAAEYDHFEVVKYLISAGANKNARDNDGNTALASTKNIDIQNYLRSLGAK
ncbi:hypothetical protein TVAG_174270 [Trichomonas vaginalis G3]|uniref:Uncharacterized protein n=1 Tax=Trichomonas vaginalis (strain ATCC PRA-98 / G3) TaxID=412133 RepID=A2EWX0_TRIV3|nr:protein ubiquitination [Trichomonas vaginalis G3]EAY02885.1 hypothetical protein TVAG_174270 [Trichomonas vaginalis G3]KAI5497405.1 protein ubiquitination [Trichomonas vaginalis G3]|eukprot:XP_001315108.1 hypothetical protein [Trichomonas vaginalis G3]